MRKFLLFITICAFIQGIYAQNLVSNYDFSTKVAGTGCPYTTGWETTGHGAPEDWNDWNSPDYYHPCSTGNFAPDNNWQGCQLPKKGTAYTGFIAWTTQGGYYTEYMWQELSTPLTSGQEYYIEFWVSNSRRDDRDNFAVKHLGMHLSASSPSSIQNSQVPPEFHNLTPQIPNTFPASNFYTSDRWTKISGTFTPSTSGVKYILIGNFDPGLNTDSSPNPTVQRVTGPEPFHPDESYYFVDAVYVGITNPNTTTSITAPQDAICPGINSTFTLINPPNQKSTSWVVSPGNLVNNPSGSGSSATFRPKYSTSSGQATITFTSVDSDCSKNEVYSKTFWVGKANYNLLGYFATNVGDVTGQTILACDYTSAEASHNGGNGSSASIDEYDWDIPYSSDWEIVEEYGGFIDMQFVEIEYYEDPPPSTETIRIRAHNNCGWSNWKEIIIDVEDNCGWGYFSYSMSPNPVDQTLSIDFEDGESYSTKSKSSNREKSSVIEVIIYDGNQVLILSQIGSTDKKMELDVSSLMPGPYYIHLVSGGEVVSKKHLIVK